MGIIPKRHIEFIRLVANGTNQMEAYKLTNGNAKVTAAAARTGGSKVAKKYAKEIELERKKVRDMLNQVNESEDAKNAFKDVLSKAERMKILSQISNGEMVLEKLIDCGGKILKRKVVPDYMDRKSAIAELNKMDGSYAPIKSQVEVTNESVDIEEFLKLRKNANKAK